MTTTAFNAWVTQAGKVLRILMMVNGDYGEREHAPAVQTLVVSFYS